MNLLHVYLVTIAIVMSWRTAGRSWGSPLHVVADSPLELQIKTGKILITGKILTLIIAARI